MVLVNTPYHQSSHTIKSATQRRAYLREIGNAVSANDNTAHSTIPATNVCLASVSPSAVQNMWHKAERLKPNAITPAPGNKTA